MPLRAGHELHEPAGPGRRDGLGVEPRFDLDDRHDQPGLDPMLPGIPFREPRHAVRQIGEAQHGGCRGLLRRSRTNGERGGQRIPLRAHRQAQRREQQADSQQRNDPFHRHS